jgi:thioredoxin-like negative regulator of GroEL
MIFITQENEIRLGKLQCIYFYASWMPFHQKMRLMLDLVEDRHQNVMFIAVDVDDFKSQCKRFEVDTIPTILVLKEGAEIKRLTGMHTTQAFINIFDDICSS